MRGKAGCGVIENTHYRITPACAGKRRPAQLPGRCGRDHPRVCGEKYYPAVKLTVDKGSPPRLRGKVFVDGEV